MDSALALIVLGIVVSANFVIILRKWRLARYFDSIVDGSILAIISLLFCGSFSGFVVGNIASACVSLWLYFNPIRFAEFIPSFNEDDDGYEFDEDGYDNYDD